MCIDFHRASFKLLVQVYYAYTGTSNISVRLLYTWRCIGGGGGHTFNRLSHDHSTGKSRSRSSGELTMYFQFSIICQQQTTEQGPKLS